MNRKIAYLVVIAGVLALAVGPAMAAQDGPYGTETPGNSTEGWMDDVNDTSIGTISGMLGRVGTFVVGNNPSNPMVGPALTGMLVGGIMVGLVGSSRAGVIAGGVTGVATLAVLSEGTGMLPTWVNGVAVILLGVMAAAVGRRLLQ
jgi:hypothetical protein